jgi:cell wall-associated NlpC family hydrolase
VRTRRFIPVLAAALVAAPQAAALPSPAIQRQRAHEREVLTRIAAINRSLESVIQAWDGARIRLAAVDRSLHRNEIALGVARQNLRVSRVRLERRLVQLYEGGRPGALDVLAGATSLTEVIDRLEAAQAVSRQDAEIGGQVLGFERTVTRREGLLKRQRRARAATVAELASRRRTITSSLATQQRLLTSIHRNISQIQAAEAARQRRLAALVQARLAREAAARQTAALKAAQDQPAQPDAPGLAPSPAPVPIPQPSPGGGHAQAAAIAAQYLGVPYVWGGESPAGFDCSGLVAYVYAQLGISLPHYTVSQWNATIPIPTSDLQPGDLVFFDGLGHVGIYIGGGSFIHAPHTGTVVQVSSLYGWGGSFVGARRVP